MTAQSNKYGFTAILTPTAEHIPGAVFFDIDVIANQTCDLPHMLPSEQDFPSTMTKLSKASTSIQCTLQPELSPLFESDAR